MVSVTVTGMPPPEFSFRYLPSPTTLFRFSALTFNGHYIHLDKDYAQEVEGYAGRFLLRKGGKQVEDSVDRLVHGPLTALMLLETAMLHYPNIRIESMEYRAQNALVVNSLLGIYGLWVSPEKIFLWCKDEKVGVVGMTGMVTIQPSDRENSKT